MRTPFQTSGGAYKDMMAYDLQKNALKSLVNRTGVECVLVLARTRRFSRARFFALVARPASIA